MLKLHGFAVSNYYNMVKLALLEKGVPFQEVAFYGGQSPEALEVSPRGKVPVLETEQGGFISETNVILDYIEATYPQKPLLPADAYARAKVRELTKEIELYIELPARSCYAEAFFGGKVDEAIKAKAKAELELGIATLKRNGKFAPYVAGEQLTVADLMFCYSIDLARGVGKTVFGVDLLAEFPQAKELIKRLQENPLVQQVAADKEKAMPAFIAKMTAGNR